MNPPTGENSSYFPQKTLEVNFSLGGHIFEYRTLIFNAITFAKANIIGPILPLFSHLYFFPWTPVKQEFIFSKSLSREQHI